MALNEPVYENIIQERDVMVKMRGINLYYDWFSKAVDFRPKGLLDTPSLYLFYYIHDLKHAQQHQQLGSSNFIEFRPTKIIRRRC